MRWPVRIAVVAAALTWFMVRQTEDMPTDTSGPGPEGMAQFTVAPPTSGPLPPADQGPWEVYATGETYLDSEGRTYDPPMADVVCVPRAELDDSGAPLGDEEDLTFHTMPVPPGQYQQGDDCP